MSAPLEGLRVVDCSTGTAGPQAAGLLADYGADVVWVEPPGGDLTRRISPASASVFNRGKRSVVLDVDDASDRATIRELAARADVFLESWVPGRASALGLGDEALHADNPGLVYASITAVGEQGGPAGLPAYEPLVHALVGTMAAQAGHREGPIFQGLPFASTGAAYLAVIGILAALYRRTADGIGRRVDTSLFDGALAFHSMLWGESDASVAAGPTIPPVVGGAARMRLITRSFLCGDGEYVGIHTGAVGAFGRLMQVLGLDDRIPPSADGIDMGVPLTAEQAALLEREIHGIFASQPRAYWVERLMAADVCAVEHLVPPSVFDEPQPRHNRMVVAVDDPVLGTVDQVAPAIRFDGRPPAPPRPAPPPGRHTDEVRAELARPAASTPWQDASPTPGVPDERPLLHDVHVLDFGAYYAGPYSSRILADLGADVIKVEPVAGDQLRGIERPFFSAQAGKRALAANLKDPGLQPAVDGLLAWADAVHHNLRPGAAERLGLGLQQVRAARPDVVYLYAPGWGSSGPHMMRQSFAPMLSGYVGASYEVAGQCNPPMPSTGNEDPGNGLLGAVALLIALLHRRRTGEALACENPQVNAAMGMMAHVVRDGAGAAVGAGLLDPLQLGIGPFERLYETADGWVCVVARADDEITALARATRVELGPADRANEQLGERLAAAFATAPTVEWLEVLETAGAPAAEPVGPNLHALMVDPEQRALGRVAEVEHPTLGRVREIAQLVRVSDADVAPHRLAPGLGEHTDDILRGLSYKPEDIVALRARGAIR
ncbi:MAG TPA: CoA transferase [Acidimicrobiia bacterium]|nr:CoA transferase [Acidimicrobiia bacterium]